MLSELSTRSSQLRAQLDSVSTNYERLKQRKIVRVGLLGAGFIRRVRAVSLSSPLQAAVRRVRPPQKRLIADLRRSRRTNVHTGPQVTIVIPSRNGARHLERLFAALEHTLYENVEVVLVDNASSDDTNKLVEKFRRWPITIERNEENKSFSDACNQGAAAGSGDYVLFLNNDTEPINNDWLSALVVCLDDGNVAAAGSVLIHPDGRTTSAEGQRPLGDPAPRNRLFDKEPSSATGQPGHWGGSAFA